VLKVERIGFEEERFKFDDAEYVMVNVVEVLVHEVFVIDAVGDRRLCGKRRVAPVVERKLHAHAHVGDRKVGRRGAAPLGVKVDSTQAGAVERQRIHVPTSPALE
jgi:hypothetical protein